jgi:MFS transporter, PAT family, beta-lactamase induction signal transducer AmpG
MEFRMAPARPLPPTWLMGFGFLPLGVSGAILLITVPQLLAANHVPEQQIASITAAGLFPSFGGFILSPLLDWRFSRRHYALALNVIATGCAFAALLAIRDLALLTALLVVGQLAITLQIFAVGGWFGNLIETSRKGALGAWFNVANAGGFGVAAAIAITLLRDLPYALGAALLSSCVLLALPLYWTTPCPPANSRLASESFRDFARDVVALLKRPTVLWTLFIFLLPVASFALTNTLGGLGRDFHTSEALVGLIGGVGTSVAGVVGSLLMPRLGAWISPRPLYLLVGCIGGLFTLALATQSHDPVTFSVAVLAENFFQGAAFSVQFAIILRAIGHENPLAATQFGLLNAAASLPLIYMQLIDGNAYALLGGVNGSYLADGAISIAFCALVGAVLWSFRGSIARGDREAESRPLSPNAALEVG